VRHPIALLSHRGAALRPMEKRDRVALGRKIEKAWGVNLCGFQRPYSCRGVAESVHPSTPKREPTPSNGRKTSARSRRRGLDHRSPLEQCRPRRWDLPMTPRMPPVAPRHRSMPNVSGVRGEQRHEHPRWVQLTRYLGRPGVLDHRDRELEAALVSEDDPGQWLDRVSAIATITMPSQRLRD